MRALLVGAGGMGRAWAKNLDSNPDVQLCGWADAVPGVAENSAQELGLETSTGTDFLKLADATGPDFIVDVTPPESHHPVTIAALSRGLPVLGEKPMATTMALAYEMVEASERSGKLYMVSQSRRYDPGLVALKEATKQLGQLGILNVDFYIGAHFGGFRDEMESPLILDMAIHTFDAARFLSGADAVTVLAEEFNPSWSWYKGDSSASAVFEMSDGSRFNYRGSWCAEGLHTSWDGDWRVVGSRGSAQWLGNGPVEMELVKTTQGFMSEVEREVVPQEEIPRGIAGSLQEFLEALRTGSTPQGECHDNIKSLAMVFAATRAAAAERRERLEGVSPAQ